MLQREYPLKYGVLQYGVVYVKKHIFVIFILIYKIICK